MSDHPILIPCEGSGCPPTGSQVEHGDGMCSMCGIFWPVVDGLVEHHLRDDVLARLDRGDFR